MLPKTGVLELRLAWTAEDDAVGMSLKKAVHRRERQPLFWCKRKARPDQVLTRHVLEKMPAFQNVLDARRELRIAEPVVLDFSQALVTDCARAEVLPIVLARRLRSL